MEKSQVENATPINAINSDLLCDINFDTSVSVDSNKTSASISSNVQDFGDFTAAFSHVSLEHKANNINNNNNR